MAIESFRDLDAWNVAMELAEAVYPLVGRLPSCERFELASQMRRAAVSIPSNVAEGHATGLRRRYRHHVRLAPGSLGELSTQLKLSGRFGYLTAADRQAAEALVVRTRQLLNGVSRSLTRELAARAGACLLIAAAIGAALL